MPKTEQKDSRSKSQNARRKALNAQLADLIRELKDEGAKGEEISKNKEYRKIMDQIDKLSQGAEMAFRRKKSGGRTLPKSSGLGMNKGGVMKKKPMNEGMKALKKEAPEVAKKMGYKKGGMAKMGYNKGGMANCGASVKPNGKARK